VRCTMGAFAVLAFSLLMVNIASAYGYGTSSISLGSYSASITSGASTSTSYTVNLASGSTWGTTLSVVNNNQLASQGVMVSLSNPSGDPPYSGTMTIQTSSTTAAGSYTITLTATGDDPSTSDANFALTVSSAQQTTAATTAPTTAGQNQTTIPTTVPQTTLPSTTVPSYTTISQNYYGSSAGSLPLESSAAIVVIILAALYGLFVWKSMLTRLVVIGTALILIGTVAWLYGDYAGGLQGYIWGGFAAILVGTAAWVYGDMRGGTFKQSVGKLVWLSIILILIGAIGWAYGELYAPGMPAYWWGGAALLVIGTFVWVYGDAKAGAFLRRGK
jgi:hypothetical protein